MKICTMKMGCECDDCVEARKIAPEYSIPARKSEETVRSSAWVGQLEAALGTITSLRKARPTKDGTEWAMRAGAQECLEWLVRNERSRCPTKQISDME